jgi:hypothetical protein
MKLEVHQVIRADVYKDIARIHHTQRNGLAEGTVCCLSVGNRHKLVAIRGLPDREKGKIRIDDVTRSALGFQDFDGTFIEADFEVEKVSFIGRLRWTWTASEPSVRIAAQLGIVSLFLGVLSLVLALAVVPWYEWWNWLARHIC